MLFFGGGNELMLAQQGHDMLYDKTMLWVINISSDPQAPFKGPAAYKCYELFIFINSDTGICPLLFYNSVMVQNTSVNALVTPGTSCISLYYSSMFMRVSMPGGLASNMAWNIRTREK